MKWPLYRKKKYSETSKVRHRLAKFCVGDGLDIGYGGDPILPTSICVDLPKPYARYLDHPQHLHGDAKNLTWFRDDSLDYIYSSHVLEDFKDTYAVLKEWLRVLKPNGTLVLFLPDEQLYREHCRATGSRPSVHHIHDHFSLAYLRNLINQHQIKVNTEHEAFPVAIYSFELVLRKL